MSQELKNIPAGVEDFKELIDGNYYYIDKTDFIRDTFSGKAVLYTRPRRFGKTLNMSMLNYFYSIKHKENRYLFDGLKISQIQDAERCQNQYPVIFLSFKDVQGDNFEDALYKYSSRLYILLQNYPELFESNKLSRFDKQRLEKYLNAETSSRQLSDSLEFLSMCLYKHYGKKVIILIDEYDVPLNSAWDNGYYEGMVSFIRSLFSQALKTNDFLEKAILTGCLRISKESIFTGLNNLVVHSITDDESASAFGFTQEEINRLYTAYGLSDHLDIVKEWYDGYRFGSIDIYNPWSTLLYLSHLLVNPLRPPETFWANTSGNSIVMDYISKAGRQRKEEFADLISGTPVQKPIRESLTYRDLKDPENIYSFLFLTGYLKRIDNTETGPYKLLIPNKEVKEIYINQFNEYFKRLLDDHREDIINAMVNHDAETMEKHFSTILINSASYHDNLESFYHGFILGLFTNCGYQISSNREAGEGRYDVVLKPEIGFDHMILLELKHSKTEDDLVKDAESALEQILDRKYLEDSIFSNYSEKIVYGISFHKKRCCVRLLKPAVST